MVFTVALPSGQRLGWDQRRSAWKLPANLTFAAKNKNRTAKGRRKAGPFTHPREEVGRLQSCYRAFAHPASHISLPRKRRRVGLHIVLFEACSAFTHVAACTLARSPIRDPLSEGFSHFVTSMTAPVASGWSVWPGGTLTHWKTPPSHGAPSMLTREGGQR
jgi:hypothetical protein